MTATAKYSAISRRALALITRKGATVQFTDPTGVLPSFTANAVQDEDDPEQFRARGLTIRNPVTLLVSAEGVSATRLDGLFMQWPYPDGAVYSVLATEPIAPDGGVIAWTVIGSG